MARNVKKATVWVDQGMINLRSEYDPHFIQALKDEIPWQMRKWVGKPDNIWRVDVSFVDLVYSLLNRHNFQVTVVEQNQPVAAPSNGENPYKKMFLYLDNDTMSKVYKIIMFKLHPDKGGNPKHAQDVNEAYERIRKELGL